MFEVLMIIGVAFLAIGAGILQFKFLSWLIRHDDLWVFCAAFCTLIGCDCFLIACMFL